MIKVLLELMVASKAISVPFTSWFLRLISASIFVLVSSVLSSLRTASLNEINILVLNNTSLAPFSGVNVTDGEIKSVVIEKDEVAAHKPVPKSIAERLLPISFDPSPIQVVLPIPSCP